MSEPPDKEFYKTIKIPLKHIIKNFEINQPKINDLTIMAHKIVIHTLQFMKMYLINIQMEVFYYYIYYVMIVIVMKNKL